MNTENPPFDLALAIDFCDSAFVFIDNDFKIQYINLKALRIFQENEELFLAIMPNFNVQNMIGLEFTFIQDLLINELQDDFLDLPLGQAMTVYSTLENLTFKIKFTVMIKDLVRVGTCIEFADMTNLAKIKQEFDQAIESANNGDFSYKINLDNNQIDNYYFHDVFRKINLLFDTFNYFIHDISVALEHLSHGNLTHCYHDFHLMSKTRLSQICDECDFYNTCYIQKESKELDKSYYNLIKKDINYTFEKLWSFVAEIKANQLNLEESIAKIILSYSEVAINTESEYDKAQLMQENVHKRTNMLRSINYEINQATHIRDITKTNNEAILSLNNTVSILSNLFNTMDQQIFQVGHICKTLDLVFSYHVKSLKGGLQEINEGNLGKGINIITNQAQEIIDKTQGSLLEIHTTIEDMRQTYISSHNEMRDLIVEILTNTSDMNNKLDLLNHTMLDIEKGINLQEEVSKEIIEFVKNTQLFQMNMVQEIEKMVYSSADLVRIDQSLKESLEAFKLADEDDFI